ncbi:MAG: type II toxin-antitoxin system PemK/MazF family toxin [Acidimicrobiales bacterium]
MPSRRPAGVGGVSSDSVVNVTSLVTVERSRVDDYLGELPASLMDQVDSGIRAVLGLGRIGAPA